MDNDKIAPAVDWQRVEFQFVNTPVTVDQLAAEFDIKPATLRQRIHRGGWQEKRRKVSQEVEQEAAQAVKGDRRKQLADWNEWDLRVATALRAMVAQAVGEAKKAKKAPPPSTIRTLVSAAESAQRIARLALGASTSSVGLGGGPDGSGPVPLQPLPSMTVDRYLEARDAVLAKY